MQKSYLFTSESVSEGHPDKVCDQISDAVLDAMLEQDPMSRVACETCTTTGLVMIMGEITTNAYVDIQKVARDTIRKIGYTDAEYGFSADSCAVMTVLDEQSTDIAMGVDKSLEAKNGEDKDDLEGLKFIPETGAGKFADKVLISAAEKALQKKQCHHVYLHTVYEQLYSLH